MEVKNNENEETPQTYPIKVEDVYALSNLIATIGLRYGFDYHKNEDLIQMVAIKCCVNSNIRYNPAKGSLKSFIAKIAQNMAIDMIRREKTRHEATPIEEEELMKLQETNDYWVGEDQSVIEERHALLERGIKELLCCHPRERSTKVFVMNAYEGRPVTEVMEYFGVTEQYVYVAVCRGKKRLREIIKKLQREEDQ